MLYIATQMVKKWSSKKCFTETEYSFIKVKLQACLNSSNSTSEWKRTESISSNKKTAHVQKEECLLNSHTHLEAEFYRQK